MTKMSAKMEAALITVTLALVATPEGELTEVQLEAMKGVTMNQLNAFVGRGILVREQRADLHWYYSVA